METKDLQAVVTLVAALIAAVTAISATIISSITLGKLQNKKRNDDADLVAFGHALDKRLKEFESTLASTNSYLEEKGKNNATKEDIEEITRKIEAIRNEYAITAELLRHQLSKKATLHKLQAEKEFEVYTKLWDILTKLRLSFEDFRPSFDPQPEGTDWPALHEKRKQAVIDGRNQLMVEIEKQSPFISDEMYSELRKLQGIALKDVLDFEAGLATHHQITQGERQRGQGNLDEFVVSLNNVRELIRIRITEP